MTNKEIIFTTSNRTDNSYFSADNDYETTYYFQVSMIDDWGYEVFSNIESIDPEYVTFIKKAMTLGLKWILVTVQSKQQPVNIKFLENKFRCYAYRHRQIWSGADLQLLGLRS